jgi:hypothetical protein
MIRLAWRQFRAQAAVAIAALAAIAVVLMVTGPPLAHLYNTTVAACAAQGDCSTARTAFLGNDKSLRLWLGVLVVVEPAIIGIFWGAPLVAREIETGTFRLAWTQSVTRTRWLAVKLGVIALAAMAVTGLLSLMVTWWARPLDQANMNQFGTFDQRDLVPVGYAAFAVVLAVTAGTLIRRTLPAMATTMVVFVAARQLISGIRPHLIAGLRRNFALDPASTGFGSSGSGLSLLKTLLGGGPQSTLQPSPPNMPNTWINSTRIVDNAGHALTSKILKSDCPGIGGGGPGPAGGPSHSSVPAAVQQRMHDCVAKVGSTYHEVVTYQPATRYWALQWYELAITLGAALILTGVCLWWVRRRLT